MIRNTITGASVGLLLFGVLLGLTRAADDEADEAEARAQNALFYGDLDGDGALSRDEFQTLVANRPQFKARPEMINPVFARLDSDKSGSLSVRELAKLGTLRPGGPGLMKKAARPQAKTGEAKPSDPLGNPKPQGPITPQQLAFFETKIRPALVTYCYECHASSAKKIKGGLVLDTREGMRSGGDSGPAVADDPGAASLLLQAIRYTDDDLKMPPKQKLPDAVIEDFERWIAMGAPDPRNGTSSVAAKAIDVEAGRRFWAFQPPKKSEPPEVKDEAWPRSPIDRFLLAKLEANRLKPGADADKRTLIRRVSFDLIGLPPTAAEVTAFLDDQSPTAFESVVDRLLASPRFGERWGRHWLDVARFAESSGKQVNINYPNAWRYRDYVIAALNEDKPFDRFIRENVAGDLLPANGDRQRAEQQIATGFLALGPKSHVERNPLQFRMDLVDEQIDATSQAFLGLTIACARCHDHKFDPIPQSDYYALAGIFRSTETCYGTVRVIQNPNAADLLTLPKDSGQASAQEPLTAEARDQLQRQIDQLKKTRADLIKNGNLFGNQQGLMTTIRLALLQSRLNSFESDGTPKSRAMGVRDRDAAVDSPLYQRGEIDKPGDVVPRGLVRVVSRENPEIRQGSGRLELADWLASSKNPLTARVFTNRVWLHLFGRGLVPTPDNFGAAGQPPSHPELLDTLAVSFMEDGWSVKRLIRQVVLTRAYQMGSGFDATNNEADPDNVLVWRMSKRRLEGEALRDAMLAISGELKLEPPQGSPVARAGEGNTAPLQRFGGNYDLRLTCRSVYLPVIRNHFLESLALFDFADPSLVIAQRATTTVPAQGLYLLNSPFVIRQAEALADGLLRDVPNDGDRIAEAYLRTIGRPPTAQEQRAARAFLEGESGDGSPRRPAGSEPGRAGWAAFCQALFASAEFLYRS
ncbi:EF hand [Singulisphaera sp. GP187]|uniref:DUF1549 domain-containing protein n=1 Tax=Singulisphaera sp. GP187 TaxID=1882752 RepID=UPI000927B1E7|nr:DUF1549 domain-containing protein [Singulisphaera sp. GP187]SIN76472.1 EF hand [Singulisphaera sp. GP187]